MNVCLIYFSTSVIPFQEEELIKLLKHSRQHNSQVGITGLLLYVRGQIMQVLEGEKEQVEALYTRIAQDARHTNVSLAINRPITQRLFDQWAMGYETISEQHLQEIKAIISLGRDESAELLLSENPILRALQVFYDGNRHN